MFVVLLLRLQSKDDFAMAALLHSCFKIFFLNLVDGADKHMPLTLS
jgi:hypothetical protein